MSKTSTNSSSEKLNFTEDWSSSPVGEWLSSHKQTIVWIFVGLLALLILAFRLIVSDTEKAENDFFRAQTAFTEFQQKSLDSQDQTAAAATLDELETIMNRHPELKPKYEGSLAQTLLITGQVTQATPFAEDIFKRTQPDHLKLYQNYSKTSLLIAENKYAEALTQAQQLKQAIEKEGANTNESLYLFNLIRLAMLNQQLDFKEEELKIWEQVQSLPAHSEVFSTASQTLTGHTSLTQYIEERKKSLK